MTTETDAVIIGSGPNGLAAAVRLASAGASVLVVEGHAELGGGTRTAELTLPGFYHDVCSAIHPMGVASPYLRTLPLAEHGLEWIHPPTPLAHPFDDGPPALLHRSEEETAAQFTGAAASNYRRLFGFLVPRFDSLLGDLMAPPQLPRHPLAAMAFGMAALPSCLASARAWFPDERLRGLIAGNAAHSVLPLDRPLAPNAIGFMLMMAAHAVGWPLARGGSGAVSRALTSLGRSLGVRYETGRWVTTMAELPKARAYLFDTGPTALANIAGERLPMSYEQRLRRFRHGPGVFKVDYALSEPIPWRDASCAAAATVHLGGSLDEIAVSEREAWEGVHGEKPFVLLSQPSLFDSRRAPKDKHTAWAYCHVPSGSTKDMTQVIDSQVERFAPGFRDIVLARHTMHCADFEAYNPNFVGGDIVGGVNDWRQLLTRPVARLRPHTTPAPDIFLCSASTPPGGGVHGMCGYWAAEAALERMRRG